jgi:hypothetical protein
MQVADEPVPTVAPDALVFEIPEAVHWILIVGPLFALGLAGCAFFVGWNDTTHRSNIFVVGTLFAGASIFGVRSARRLRYKVALNPEGIWYLPSAGESLFMAWRDVASVTANDTQQWLVLVDHLGSKSIKLDYQLQDFGRLRDFVLRHVPAMPKAPAVASRVFHRTWINKAILLALSLVCVDIAWYGQRHHQARASWIFIGLAAGCFLALTRDPTRVSIAEDGVLVEYPGWKQLIPFRTISDIELRDVSDRGNAWAVVIVKRYQGKALRLIRFREGSIALRDALQAARSAAAAKGSG